MSADTQEVWAKFNVSLKRFILKRVNNEQDAEDILQNVFVKIHQNTALLRNSNKIGAWIYRIARNAIIDYYRSRQPEGLYQELPEDLADSNTEEINEVALCIKAMIEFLPDKYKQALMLTEFENVTQKDLATRLGISVSGAKSRVQRARAKLKEMLLACCNLEYDRLGRPVNYRYKNSECRFCADIDKGIH